jgi:hypothetical protein
MESCLYISDQEGILAGCLILEEHHGEILRISVVILSISGVLILPSLSLGEQREIPPVIEGIPLVIGYFGLIHDHGLECVKLGLGQPLVHLHDRRRLHLIEAEVGYLADDLGLGLRREDGLDD